MAEVLGLTVGALVVFSMSRLLCVFCGSVAGRILLSMDWIVQSPLFRGEESIHHGILSSAFSLDQPPPPHLIQSRSPWYTMPPLKCPHRLRQYQVIFCIVQNRLQSGQRKRAM